MAGSFVLGAARDKDAGEPSGEPRASINRGERQGMRGINRQAAATGSDGTEEILNTTLINGWMWI